MGKPLVKYPNAHTHSQSDWYEYISMIDTTKRTLIYTISKHVEIREPLIPKHLMQPYAKSRSQKVSDVSIETHEVLTWLLLQGGKKKIDRLLLYKVRQVTGSDGCPIHSWPTWLLYHVLSVNGFLFFFWEAYFWTWRTEYKGRTAPPKAFTAQFLQFKWKFLLPFSISCRNSSGYCSKELVLSKRIPFSWWLTSAFRHMPQTFRRRACRSLLYWG